MKKLIPGARFSLCREGSRGPILGLEAQPPLRFPKRLLTMASIAGGPRRAVLWAKLEAAVGHDSSPRGVLASEAHAEY